MQDSVVISSKIRLARNIKELPFPNKLCDFESATSVLKAVSNIFGEDFEYRRLKNFDFNQCLKLLEDHTITKELIDNKDISGYAKSFDGNVVIMINEDDHLREQVCESGLNLSKCYQKINNIDEKLLNKLDIAFDSKFGFLTANPKNSGTGMKASVVMFLPALSFNGSISQLESGLDQIGLSFCPIYKTQGASEGYFYMLSNKYTFGLSEKETIDLVEKNAKMIVDMEQNTRETLKSVNENVIKNMSYRAYGILTNSYILPCEECVDLLSKLKFGIVMGFVNLKNASVVDDLFKEVMPAHIQDYYSLELSPIEMNIFRAKYVLEHLENKMIKGVR